MWPDIALHAVHLRRLWLGVARRRLPSGVVGSQVGSQQLVSTAVRFLESVADRRVEGTDVRMLVVDIHPVLQDP